MPIRAALLLTLVLVLGGCGGENPYCTSVENARATLDTFGAERTDEAFAGYARTMTSIAGQAPASSQDDWTELADATQGVITAHEEVGFALEDMTDADAREGLSEGDIEQLNAAYEAFNDTQDQRKAIIADVDDVCGIELR